VSLIASYFPGLYFPDAYFPGEYFPYPNAPPVYASFAEALAAALAADGPLGAAFRGGFSNSLADRDRKWPFCVFNRVGARPAYQVIGRRQAVKEVTVSFHVFARSPAAADSAESLAELLKSRLLPSYGADGETPFDPAPLAWARGQEVTRFQPGPRLEGSEWAALSPALSGASKDVYESVVVVTWLCVTW
jgi:hypothetical protein